MSTLKTKLKSSFLLIVILFISAIAFAQKPQADTLVINTAKGKVILISDSLLYFKGPNTLVLINKALEQVKDSLPKTDSLKKKPLRFPKDSLYSKILKRKRTFLLGANFGSGLMLGRIVPQWGLSLDFAPQRQDFYFKRNTIATYTFINIAVNSNWFFEKANQTVETQYLQNLFIEASFGNRINNLNPKRLRQINEFSLGVGYLIQERGNYFENNTFKLFGTIVPNGSFIGFKPEIYFTDNFKTIYPGLSLRLVLPFSNLFNP